MQIPQESSVAGASTNPTMIRGAPQNSGPAGQGNGNGFIPGPFPPYYQGPQATVPPARSSNGEHLPQAAASVPRFPAQKTHVNMEESQGQVMVNNGEVSNKGGVNNNGDFRRYESYPDEQAGDNAPQSASRAFAQSPRAPAPRNNVPLSASQASAQSPRAPASRAPTQESSVNAAAGQGRKAASATRRPKKTTDQLQKVTKYDAGRIQKAAPAARPKRSPPKKTMRMDLGALWKKAEVEDLAAEAERYAAETERQRQAFISCQTQSMYQPGALDPSSFGFASELPMYGTPATPMPGGPLGLPQATAMQVDQQALDIMGQYDQGGVPDYQHGSVKYNLDPNLQLTQDNIGVGNVGSWDFVNPAALNLSSGIGYLGNLSHQTGFQNQHQFPHQVGHDFQVGIDPQMAAGHGNPPCQTGFQNQDEFPSQFEHDFQFDQANRDLLYSQIMTGGNGNPQPSQTGDTPLHPTAGLLGGMAEEM
ncbi:hypothetical protein CONLIGDRAFT_343744 [Coniochaeta ligniaria NRRL 30616]|uniref:Uncharacterized protein n=1 Tax=Coniochaeta ligniaria NRRL 30616 TaxID=1408157 RepID=A0A1J7IQX7_9PEZI|nr:hypothetical protein CONLIGDRAFT_343744 [Coniochaeta ligniaria NRRL 30616]